MNVIGINNIDNKQKTYNPIFGQLVFNSQLAKEDFLRVYLKPLTKTEELLEH
jgi:hypothetical protein